MKTYLLPFILLSFFPFAFLSAQTLTQTIRGQVLDRDSRQPLIGVAAFVQEVTPTIGQYTDEKGYFRLENVPVGKRSLAFRYLGYRELVFPNVEVTSAKEVVLTIELEEQVTSTEAVVITSAKAKNKAINELSTVSSRQFSTEETGRYAGSRGDVARMAANFAGVSGSNDARNDIIIRGNSPNGLLWRFEGLDIPSPNHFSGVGTNGGPISLLNNNVLSNSDFMTGAFPAEYGNALSGVFDLHMRNGNNERREHTAQLGMLGTELMTEGPFSANYDGSYLINYRYSTTAILTELGVDFGYSGRPTYQDGSFKLNLPTQKLGTFKIFGMFGLSNYVLLNSERDTTSFDVNPDGTNTDYATDLAVGGISHQLLLSGNAYIKTVVGVSMRDEQAINDSVSTADEAELIPYFRSHNRNIQLTAHSFLSKKFSARHKLKTGIIFDRFSYKISENVYDPLFPVLQPQRAGSGNTYLIRAYTHWQYRPSDKVTVNTGLHYQRLLLNGSQSLEPRLGVSWQPDERQSVSFAYGLHSQRQLLPTYFVATPTASGVLETNRDLDFSKSHHLVLGYDRSLAKDLRLKAEVYGQWLYDIPVHGAGIRSSFSALNEGGGFILADEDSLVNGGLGRNLGVELTVEKFFSQNYYFLVTASLFDAQYQGSDAVWRHTRFDGTYILNALAGKEFPVGKSGNNRLILDLKVSLAGGQRYTPVDLAASQLAQQAVYEEENAFSKTHDTYFRTDAKVSYRLNRQKVAYEFFVNVDNVFDTQNIFDQTFSRRTGQLASIYQLGRFPTFNIKMEF